MQEIENGKVYKIVNNKNDKVYIGITTRNLKSRFGELKRCIWKRHGKFQRAMVEIGTDNFDIVLLEDNIKTLSELSHKEQQYIILYDAQENGYNTTNGGEVLPMTFKHRESISQGMLPDKKQKMLK